MHHDQTLQPRPSIHLLWREYLCCRNLPQRSALNAMMSGLSLLRVGVVYALKCLGLHGLKLGLCLLQQRRMIAFEGENIVALLRNNLLSNGTLRSHRINADDTTGQR